MATRLALVALAAAALLADRRAFAGESASPQIIARWDFNTPGDPQGFTVGQNVSDLLAADGCLRFKSLTNDPFIFAPPVEAALDGCVVRVAIRCRMASDTQVYWVTPDYPNYGEQQVMNRYAPGRGEGFTILEFPIGKPSDAGRRLTGFRIDPCSGPVGELGEIDFVELVRVPPLLEVSLSFDRHRVDVSESSRLAVRARQIAGWKDATTRTVTIAGRPGLAASQPESQRTTLAGADMKFTTPGIHQQRAVLQEPGGTAAYDLEASILIGDGEALPLVAATRTGRLRLDLVRIAESEAVGAARLQAGDGKQGWRPAGWLLPLARLTVLTEDGVVRQREPALMVHAASDGWTRLEGTASDLPGWRIQVDIAAAKSPDTLEVTATLAGPPGGKVLEFAGPALRVDPAPAPDPLQRYAMFGGLEMLQPGWPSSSERAIGEKFAERHTPHPYKITVPLMVVESGGLTTGLMWQPLQNWDGRNNCPTATFASPDFLTGQPNHLMRLWVPGVPDWVAENQLYAHRPYVMAAGQPLTIRYQLYARPNAPALLAAREWFEAFGIPEPPPELHDDSELHDLIAQCYGRTMYWPEQKGWTQHWFFEQPPGYQPEMAGFLVGHAAEVGERRWIEETNLSGRRLIDAAVPLAARVGPGDQHARAVAAAMRADGTWPFNNTERIRKLAREITNGKYDNLGENGATELGVCSGNALVILQQARICGDPELIAAGRKALEAMRRFKVPRGAQVWEVHLEIPDIRAAALAVEAFQIGYHLTGETSYLDDASYWAWTGVPFVYAWHVPAEHKPGTFVGSRDRQATARASIPLGACYSVASPQVTPYGTLPVLGPTFYAINWFGVLVQWCGLEWAEKVILLDADRPNPALRAIADGVVRSGLQQMMDKEPWTGLYPDSWLLEQNIAQPAMIYPGLILACRQAQGRLPAWSKPWTRVIADGTGARRWHVTGWGKPLSLAPPGQDAWSAEIEFLPGEPNELVLARVASPRAVSAGSRSVAQSAAPGREGWTYDTARRMILLRFVQTEPTTRVRIEW